MRAPGNSAAPVAMKQPASIVVPLTCACGPISTSSPIVAGCCSRPRISAFSMITQRSPTVIAPSSAVSTAPNRTRAPAPIVTSPHRTAVGAT